MVLYAVGAIVMRFILWRRHIRRAATRNHTGTGTGTGNSLSIRDGLDLPLFAFMHPTRTLEIIGGYEGLIPAAKDANLKVRNLALSVGRLYTSCL